MTQKTPKMVAKILATNFGFVLDCLTHYALWNFTSNGVGHFSELVDAHT